MHVYICMYMYVYVCIKAKWTLKRLCVKKLYMQVYSCICMYMYVYVCMGTPAPFPEAYMAARMHATHWACANVMIIMAPAAPCSTSRPGP